MRVGHTGPARRPTTTEPRGRDQSVAAAGALDRLVRRLRGDRDERRRQREQLVRRLDASGPLGVTRQRPSRLPPDRCRLSLVDGTEIRARLLWPPAGTPAAVAALRWWDEIGWEIKIVDGRGETLTWYAWSVVVDRPRLTPPS